MPDELLTARLLSPDSANALAKHSRHVIVIDAPVPIGPRSFSGMHWKDVTIILARTPEDRRPLTFLALFPMRQCEATRH